MALDNVCVNCGTAGKPKTRTRGSFGIELILWLCFLVPGLIYSAWRLSSRQKVCRACNSTDLLPANTPRGQQVLKQFGTTMLVFLTCALVFTGCAMTPRQKKVAGIVAGVIVVGAIAARDSDHGGSRGENIPTPRVDCQTNPEACR